jgi:HEPN domain-containing protein
LPESEASAEAARWFACADENLSAARTLRDAKAQPSRQVCWFAQQAAEKALKAALILHQLEFPRTHDLDALRNLLAPRFRRIEQLPDLAELGE